MEPRQGLNSRAFATFVVVCLGVLALVLGGSFLLLLTTGNIQAPAVVLLGIAVGCYVSWLVLAMDCLSAWRLDPSVRFSPRRKRWTAILLSATAVLLVLAVLAGQG